MTAMTDEPDSGVQTTMALLTALTTTVAGKAATVLGSVALAGAGLSVAIDTAADEAEDGLTTAEAQVDAATDDLDVPELPELPELPDLVELPAFEDLVPQVDPVDVPATPDGDDDARADEVHGALAGELRPGDDGFGPAVAGQAREDGAALGRAVSEAARGGAGEEGEATSRAAAGLERAGEQAPVDLPVIEPPVAVELPEPAEDRPSDPERGPETSEGAGGDAPGPRG